MRSGACARVSATPSAHPVRTVRSSTSRTRGKLAPVRADGDLEPASEARIWCTATSKRCVPVSTGQRPSPVRRVARELHAVRSTACAPDSSGISRKPRSGSFQSATIVEASQPPRPAALHHPERGQGQDGRPWVVGQHTRVAGRPAGCQLRSVQQDGDDAGRADGPDDLGDLVVFRQVLAHERDDRDLLAECQELHRPAWNLHRLPPPDVRVQGASEVVLVDLGLVERPPMVLVLADVKPLLAGAIARPSAFSEPRVHARMHPVLPEAAPDAVSADGPRP